ncbi:hypothetical protein LINPERHAP1_LOCUS40523 [Linum perenne]
MALEAAHETQAGYSTLLPPRVEGTHLWNGDPMHVFKDSTRNKILKWDPSIDIRCLLCNFGIEDRNHIFFEYPYPTAIVQKSFL